MSLHRKDNAEFAQQRAVLDALPVPVFALRAGRVVFANLSACQRMGWETTAPLDLAYEDVFRSALPNCSADPENPEWLSADHPFQSILQRPRGHLEAVTGRCAPAHPALGDVLILLYPGQPALLPLTVEEILNSLPDPLAILRGDNTAFVNSAFTRLFGFEAGELQGLRLTDLIVPDHLRHESSLVRKNVDEKGRAALDTVRKTKNGELIDVSLLASPLMVNGVCEGYLLIYHDIAERKRAENKLQYEAMHDPLTGLPNRTLFMDRLSLALSRRSRSAEQNCGVLFLDLDRFKEINDTMGHAAGDLLLIEVAARISRAVRPQDTAARLGGDEFAILAENIHNVADLQAVANRISSEAEQPYLIHGQTIHAPISIGAAISGSGQQTPESLVRDADYAMYRAKQAGGARNAIFDKNLAMEAAGRREREDALRSALESRHFVFFLDPIFRLENGKLEGFTLQLRWSRPDGALDNLGDLATLTEDAGISAALFKETAEAACGQILAWNTLLPHNDLTLAFSVSRRQFYSLSFVEQLCQTLSSTGISPAQLLLEVSENTLGEKPQAARAILKSIAAENLRVAVDHFGSSLAPINHLVRMPIDAVKLDPKIVTAIGGPGRQAAILESLIQLGRSLGVQVVADGIENPAQLETLRQLGCELGQGRYLSEALDADRATQLAQQGIWSIKK